MGLAPASRLGRVVSLAKEYSGYIEKGEYNTLQEAYEALGSKLKEKGIYTWNGSLRSNYLENVGYTNFYQAKKLTLAVAVGGVKKKGHPWYEYWFVYIWDQE